MVPGGDKGQNFILTMKHSFISFESSGPVEFKNIDFEVFRKSVKGLVKELRKSRFFSIFSGTVTCIISYIL